MVRNALLVVVSIAVALAICEGLLRAVGRDLLPRPDLYDLDPDVGKRMRPGWSGTEFGGYVQINTHGLRNPETTYEKPPGTFRVLALGDSWTFGFHLAEEDSYPRQLERILNARLEQTPGTPRIEVINTGVVGYSTYQEAAYFRVEGYRYEPDLVVVAFYPVNDAEDKSSKYERYHRLREIHPALLELYTFPRKLYLRQFWKGVRRALKRTWAKARVSLADALGTRDAAAEAILEHDWTPRFRPGDRGWELAREGFRSIGETARQLGVPVLGVLLPDLVDLARYEDRYHPRVAPLVREAASEAGLDWLDLLDAFRPYRGNEDAVRLRKRRHPDAAGYRLIAEVVADRIEDRYLPGGPERATVPLEPIGPCR